MFAVSLRTPPVVARTDHDPGDVKARNRSEDETVEHIRNEDLTEGITRHQKGLRFVSRSTGHQMDVPQFAHRVAHTCASFAWNHTGRWSARGTQVGHPQPKGVGKGKGKNKGKR